MSKRRVAPRHLTPQTRAWWCGICREYELQSHHIKLLTLGAECLDRLGQVREILAREGLTSVTKSTGALHVHPLLKTEIELKTAFCRIMRELNLDDVEPPAEPF